MDKDDYFEAARERLAQANQLISGANPPYGLIHYLAGLSTECLLRAYAMKRTAEFDARHDLRSWYDKAGFDSVVPSGKRQEIDAALNQIATQWNSNQRYWPDRLLAAHFRKAGLTTGTRGNLVKALARPALESASLIVELGTVKWKSKI